MNQNPEKKPSAREVVKEIKRRARRVFSVEEKIKIALEGFRGEDSIATICRKHGIHTNFYFKWGKDILEAGASLVRIHLISSNFALSPSQSYFVNRTSYFKAVIPEGLEPPTDRTGICYSIQLNYGTVANYEVRSKKSELEVARKRLKWLSFRPLLIRNS